jgi:glycine dehydrogenase
MLARIGYSSLDAFLDDTVPKSIRIAPDIINDQSIPPLDEAALLRKAKELGRENKPFRSYIGMGYHNAVVPSPILRNVRFSEAKSAADVSPLC